MAPEHALGKAITVKADVYSYGVVVLEIVSGRSNTEYIPNQEADFLLDTVSDIWQDYILPSDNSCSKAARQPCFAISGWSFTPTREVSEFG